jgi:hypothetical protein
VRERASVAELVLYCAYLCQDVREGALIQGLQLHFAKPCYRIYLRIILPMGSHYAYFGSTSFRPFEYDLSWKSGTET